MTAQGVPALRGIGDKSWKLGKGEREEERDNKVTGDREGQCVGLQLPSRSHHAVWQIAPSPSSNLSTSFSWESIRTSQKTWAGPSDRICQLVSNMKDFLQVNRDKQSAPSLVMGVSVDTSQSPNCT